MAVLLYTLDNVSGVLMVRTGPLVGLGAQVMLLAALTATVGLSIAGWLTGLAYGLTITAMLSHGLAGSDALALGPANQVTLTRATLVGGVTALIADAFVRPVALTVLVLLAVVALCLDAADGWIARRTATVSAFGARFDMEIDAFLILALSIYVARSVGAWVLVIGAARYLLGAASWFVGWIRRAVPARYWRKVVAAIQGVTLTIAAASVLPRPAVQAMLAAALVLLIESFGRDLLWLWLQQIAAGRARLRGDVESPLTAAVQPR